MTFQIPSHKTLSTNTLSNIFKDTTASYKYYWFLSILNHLIKTDDTHIRMWDIIISMIANAWYPIHYFKLSFRKSDSMYSSILRIQEITGLPINSDSETIHVILKERIDNHDKEIQKILRIFSLNVPFRFLNPWIHSQNNKEIVTRSQSFENGCLYSLVKDNSDSFYVNINPQWVDYLHQNYQILLDFTYWNLANFLQVRNPNVPNITNKLIRPGVRKSLTRQREFWNIVIEAGGPIHCIYTGKTLYKNSFDLDHFIPWSFVTHDLAWNLTPSDSSINSSKSDKIPNINTYLPKLANTHHRGLETYLSKERSSRYIEDYLTLGYSIQDLLTMNDETFYKVFFKTFYPLAQVAENMGFEHWNY